MAEAERQEGSEIQQTPFENLSNLVKEMGGWQPIPGDTDSDRLAPSILSSVNSESGLVIIRITEPFTVRRCLRIRVGDITMEVPEGGYDYDQLKFTLVGRVMEIDGVRFNSSSAVFYPSPAGEREATDKAVNKAANAFIGWVRGMFQEGRYKEPPFSFAGR